MLDYLADNLIALLAVVIASIALFFSSKQIKLERRIVEIEQERERQRESERGTATIRAKLVEDHGTRIRLTNFGVAEARDLSVLLDGQPYHEHTIFVKGSAKLFDYLASGADADIAVSFTTEMRDPVEVDIRWEDDSGAPGRYRVLLGPGKCRTLRVVTHLY